jgi:hypothetical protein
MMGFLQLYYNWQKASLRQGGERERKRERGLDLFQRHTLNNLLFKVGPTS